MFRIQPAESNRGPLKSCRYFIFDGNLLIAHYWHDCRGDEHGIEFINGDNEDWPAGRMPEFVVGGGGEPLVLTELAQAYLRRNLERPAGNAS